MAKQKLENEAIMVFFQTLSNINGVKNTNFNFTKAQNKASLERKAKPLIETEAEIHKHIEGYNKEHIALLVKYANKDKNGEPIIKQKTGYMTVYDLSKKNQEIVNKELKALRENKYKKQFATFDKELKKFEVILKQQQEVDIVKFKQKDLPPDLDDVMDVLFKYIE